MEKKKATYMELAQHFEVSKKTIMRDIDKLSVMGIPVYTKSGYEGGVFLSEDYRFKSNFFTPKEIEDIILAFHIVHHLNPKNGKSSVLKKLELLVPELVFFKEFDFDKYLKVELFSNSVSAETPICNMINVGLDEEKFLDITIEEEHYTIVPLHYILRPNGLYLYCTDRKNFFTFEVNKISECKIID